MKPVALKMGSWAEVRESLVTACGAPRGGR